MKRIMLTLCMLSAGSALVHASDQDSIFAAYERQMAKMAEKQLELKATLRQCERDLAWMREGVREQAWEAEAEEQGYGQSLFDIAEGHAPDEWEEPVAEE